MLTASYLETVPEPIIRLYRELEDSVLADMARRIIKMDMSAASAWQMQRITESGAVYDKVLDELARLTGRSESELRTLFNNAGVKTLQFDDAIYKAAGLDPLPLNLSPAMADVLRSGLETTGGIMRNLTMTTANSAQNAFINAADLAYMQVTSGTLSYDEAIKRAIKDVASDGLRVLYPSGHSDHLDVAMRRTVLTGVSQTASKLQERRADDMGADLVKTSAHIGARNTGTGPANHQSWQGKVFSRSGTHEKYPDFVQSTGYGTGEGLGGWNCRHSWFPFFEGVSAEHYKRAELSDYANKRVTYNGDEMSVYEATQKQRAIERSIRKWKREANALEAANIDATEENKKVRFYQAQMRNFIKQTELNRQRFREQVFAT